MLQFTESQNQKFRLSESTFCYHFFRTGQNYTWYLFLFSLSVAKELLKESSNNYNCVYSYSICRCGSLTLVGSWILPCCPPCSENFQHMHTHTHKLVFFCSFYTDFQQNLWIQHDPKLRTCTIIIHPISQFCSFPVTSSPHESVIQSSQIWSKLLNSTSWIWWNRHAQMDIILPLKVPQLTYHHWFPVWPHTLY